MFKRLAEFRHSEPRHLLPYRLVPVHCNDNQPGRRRPAVRRRSHPPALACHWSLVDESRLEGRWQIECSDGSST